ncbi:uncharacterized protein BDZ83DRAFT_613953 [Colletotrichum acutatum]|uniref:Uncharacterized protein n=1 Tax=Glomerella acutata TaxID=27357 RepID=A0AAD8XJ13_GLOAC|nr:uncharacterized protein BDZ83DRAFT_613953 [Colletotrichum acutatum]KAK1727018.1 hypothetical protein BDZ83DRAFT_613953 [Colletotrichum acutatum]
MSGDSRSESCGPASFKSAVSIGEYCACAQYSGKGFGAAPWGRTGGGCGRQSSGTALGGVGGDGGGFLGGVGILGLSRLESISINGKTCVPNKAARDFALFVVRTSQKARGTGE